MTQLPVISGRQLVKALEKIGFVVKRRHSSHIILRRNDPFTQTVVPDHKELDRGTLRAILRQVDLSTRELRDLL